jgi:RecJ-like exonuclease
MNTDKEEIKEAFKVIQTQILEVQGGMNTLADAMIELTKRINNLGKTRERRFKVVCGNCDGAGYDGNCDYCEGSGYVVIVTKNNEIPRGAFEETNYLVESVEKK